MKNTYFNQRNKKDIKKYWAPGMQITEEDLKLLEEVKAVYYKQGYVPTMNEVSNVQKLKARFRTWNNVLCAAGLPSRNNPSEQKKRQRALEQQRR